MHCKTAPPACSGLHNVPLFFPLTALHCIQIKLTVVMTLQSERTFIISEVDSLGKIDMTYLVTWKISERCCMSVWKKTTLCCCLSLTQLWHNWCPPLTSARLLAGQHWDCSLTTARQTVCVENPLVYIRAVASAKKEAVHFPMQFSQRRLCLPGNCKLLCHTRKEDCAVNVV